MFLRSIKLLNKTNFLLKSNFMCFNFATKIVPIILPDLGEGTKEATVKQWYKKVGDQVEEVIFF